MPKIGVEFRKRYVIEAQEENEAIRKAWVLCKKDLQELVSDEKRTADELFQIYVIATEVLFPDKVV